MYVYIYIYIYIYIHVYLRVCCRGARRGQRRDAVRARGAADQGRTATSIIAITIILTTSILTTSIITITIILTTTITIIITIIARYGWKTSSSSNFSARAFRVGPLMTIRQTAPCRGIRGNGISVNSTLPPLSKAMAYPMNGALMGALDWG